MTSQIPALPQAFEMSPYYAIILAINLVVLAGVLLWTGRDSLRTKSAIPLLILAGAAVAALQEALYDANVLVAWAEYGHTPLYSAFDRAIPIWMIICYPWYIGGSGYFMYKSLKAGMSRETLWKLYFFGWFANMFLEIPALQLGNIYTYYGDQPLVILGFPLWMAFTNTLMPILAGAFVYAFEEHLRGWRSLAVVAMIPMATASAEIATGWPIWTALNAGQGLGLTYIAAFVVLGLSLLTAWLVSIKFCHATEKAAVAEHLRPAGC